MKDLINIGVRSIFIDNMIFAYFLGMCSFLAISKKVKTAFGLGIAVIFVIGVTVPINWMIQNYVLNAGALAWLGDDFANVDLNFLQFIVFISVPFMSNAGWDICYLRRMSFLTDATPSTPLATTTAWSMLADVLTKPLS